MTTARQTEANRTNARHSTGPKSEGGKFVSSGNRITHGILSTKLLLPDEQVEDYQALLDGLIADLRPEGTVELVLVEKIAVVLWRQRRLVTAEAGTTVLAANSVQVKCRVYGGMRLPDYPGQDLRLLFMETPDASQQEWCRTVLAEYEHAAATMLDELAEKCPLIYEQLVWDAEGEQSICSYVDSYCGGLVEYVRVLLRWCRRQLQDAERYLEAQELSNYTRATLSVPWERLELLSKYQTSLDNQLYKALAVLRQAQVWRVEKVAMSGEVSAGPEG